MVEFCKCGSMIIGESCTNKNCTNTAGKTDSKKPRTAKSKTAKSPKSRRASKMITYNIYETEEEEENIEEDAL